MSFVNYISFSRAVSSPLKPSQNNIPIFKGSSLNRKPYERKQDKMASLPSSPVCQTNNENKKREQEIDHLRSNPARERRANGKDKDNRKQLRTFSKRSRDKCRNKIFALFHSCKADFTFLTLTMVGDSSDQQAQQCLNKFLTVLRSRYGLFSY